MVEKLRLETGRKPVVGLAGFFGYGNYGDELFVSVYKQFLQDDFDLRFLADKLEQPYYSRPPQDVVAEVDAIVIGGGDIIQPWNLDARYFSKEFLKKPVFVVGVGVPIRANTNKGNAEKDWIVQKYKNFLQHPSVKMIHARDEQSCKWIMSKAEPAVEVIESPDLVCSLNLPPVAKSADQKILGIVTRQRPDLEDDYSQINALADQQRARGWRVRHIILGTGIVGVRDRADADDIRGDKELIYTESLTELTEAIGGCTALVSMKFHGTVVATMYGVPSTVLIPTNKNRNFMKRIGRDDLLSKFDDPTLCSRFDPEPAPHDPVALEMLRSRATDVMVSLRQGLHRAIGY
ncbi:polysaccharide pyruvyl transferase family protein [Sphingomonas sp. VDB2]|uniref:polysaccharide pyruvyl transferase family protein n=1 Tax=Sphingomonas sp. VDB2 TaxID=3228751 RepID=UPI003A807E14